MTKGRLEAFSDAVIAIIMTIMVLELRAPIDTTVMGLREIGPVFGSYVLSFVILAIYWNNHHHMFQAVSKVNGKVLWANMHLLFWLSLFPFAASWMGQGKFESGPVMAYGVTMFLSAVAYFLLTKALVGANGKDSAVARALGQDYKGRASILIAGVSAVAGFWVPMVAAGLFVLITIIWFIPDRRFEDLTSDSDSSEADGRGT